MKRWIVIGAALASASTAAFAQDTYYWPAPAALTQQTKTTYFPMGTALALRTRTEANSKQMKPGDRVYLEVAESLTYRGQIVVPVGSPAVGEVIRSERNGHFGKKGQIEVSLLYVETPYGPIRLAGEASNRGKDAGVWSIGGAALVAWPLVFMHGTSAYIRHGTPVMSYLAEPLHFQEQVAPPVAQGRTVQPDDARSLPARFDPSVFGGAGPGSSNR